MSGRATLIHAAFRKSEEIDDEKGEKGEFAVNSFPLVLIMMGSDVGRPATRRPDASRSPKRHPNLVQRKRKNRVLRGIVHQVCAGRSPKRHPNLVQGKRRNRALRGIVHQVCAGRSPKRHPNLVQGKRRNRALRGIVHQVCAGRSPKRHPDLVQRKRRNRVLRGIVHQVCAQWAFGGSDVVLHPHQSLDPSSRGTTSPGSDGHSVEPTWCFTPAKALIFRRGAPRRPRPAGHRLVRRGASPPPKP